MLKEIKAQVRLGPDSTSTLRELVPRRSVVAV